MEGFNTHGAQLRRHASSHYPAPLHGLDILEGKTALAVVLVRTGREINGMLFSKGDEARSRCGTWEQSKIHHDTYPVAYRLAEERAEPPVYSLAARLGARRKVSHRFAEAS
jgi:hypothetical protein